MTNLRSRPLVTLSQAQVDVIIRKHEKLNSGVLGGARADFSFHDLSGLNLVNCNLSDTNFTGARLFKTDLSGTTLERAAFFRRIYAGPICAGLTLLAHVLTMRIFVKAILAPCWLLAGGRLAQG